MNPLSRRNFLQTAAAAGSLLSAAPAGPAPFGPLPSERQLRWHQLEFYGFLHFTVNTFTDREWGLGDEDPKIFAPTAFDADAIVAGLRSAGMKGVILTCKHHDGFCLWPTQTTEHCIRGSAWRSGRGDVVREVSEAARKQGLAFGVYVSPWDRNHPAYGKPEYLHVYREQLRELLTGYGPLFEVWFDGANGGDGYYGGAREKRTIDKLTYYEWPKTWEMVRSLQPDAVMFSDVGPDIRWVGNESGLAKETCWATWEPVGPEGGGAAPGHVRESELGTGTPHRGRWLPAECDVSIRPGWFWHEKEDGRVKSPRQLMDIYFRSVGLGGSMLLNVPPDRRGLLGEADLTSLRGFGQLLRGVFSKDVARGADASASSALPGFSARQMIDGDPSTYWAAAHSDHRAEITLKLSRPARLNVIRLREPIAIGQRIDEFEVLAETGDEWKPVARGTSVGACRLLRVAEPVESRGIRLRILRASASPALGEFSLFLDA